MPHIILEHSDNIPDQINYQNLFAQLHQILNQDLDVPINAIKSRRYISKDHYIANGNSKNFFIHLQISLLAGRTEEKLQKCAKNAKLALHVFFKQSNQLSETSFSVEIRQMDPNLYQK